MTVPEAEATKGRDRVAEEIEFLSRTALDFVSFSDDRDIYLYIAERVREMAGTSVVSVSSYDAADSAVEIRSLVGLGRLTQRVIDAFGKNPVGMRMPAWPRALDVFASGRVIDLLGGLHELMFETIPKPVCAIVERLLGLKSTHVLGMVRDGRVLAAAAILRQTDETPLPTATLEAFTSQASIALQRQAAEAALVESVDRHRQLLEDLHEIVYEMDSGGMVTYISPATRRTLGYEPEEVIGAAASAFVHPDDVPTFRRHIQQRLATGIPTTSELRFRSKGGPCRWMRTTGRAVRDRSGNLVLRGVAFDVTEERALLQRLQDAGREEQERIGRDLHDGLGQELTGIACLATTLQQNLAKNELPQQREAARVAELLDDARRHIRAIARSLNPVPHGPEGLLRALEQLVESVEDTHDIACSFSAMSCDDLGDPARATHLYRIVQEAVSNAVSHGRADSIDVRLSMHDGECSLEIEDDGTGLPDDAGATRGMGLGTMRYRAARMGGTLEVEPTAAGGTLVRCTFPLRLTEKS